MQGLLKTLSISMLALSLSGCAPDQERASNECSSLGFQPGTIPFNQCYQATMQRYAAAWATLATIGQVQSQPQPYYVQAAPELSPPIQTTCRQAGFQVICTTQ